MRYVACNDLVSLLSAVCILWFLRSCNVIFFSDMKLKRSLLMFQLSFSFALDNALWTSGIVVWMDH